MAIELKASSNFSKTRKHIGRLSRLSIAHKLKPYAEKAVYELAKNTPIDTGATAMSWSYDLKTDRDGVTIKFTNSNAPNGVCVAVLIQNGHATRSGTWIEGIDYINPAIQPVFKEIVEMIQREVRRS